MEEQLRTALTSMEEALEKSDRDQFAEERKIALLLFKEGIHPAVRAELWETYCELTEKSRGLASKIDALQKQVS